MLRINGGEIIQRRSLKALAYIVILSILLAVLNFLFGWSSRELVPSFLQPYSDIILLINPYLIYVQAALVTVLGAFIINSFSNAAYAYMLRLADQSAAATMKTVVRVVGIAILISALTSMVSANPSAALTVGSFSGLVVGFATQTVLSHFVAGIFILLTRPVKFGDVVTMVGQTGVVKEMRLMHLVLETQDGTTEILIPNGIVFSQVILRRKIVAIQKPVTIEVPAGSIPRRAIAGSKVTFNGRLTEKGEGKPVAGALVKFVSEDGKVLSSSITESDGKFMVEWTASRISPKSSAVKAYMKFDGDSEYQEAKSETIAIELAGKEE